MFALFFTPNPESHPERAPFGVRGGSFGVRGGRSGWVLPPPPRVRFGAPNVFWGARSSPAPNAVRGAVRR